MGMYTEIYVNVDLKRDTPEEVMTILRTIVNPNGELPSGFPQRWEYLFNSGSYYTPNTCCASLTYDRVSDQWSLLGKGDIKNYGWEIEQFFSFLKPYIDAEEGEFIGYNRYEESNLPTLVFM